MANKKPLHGFPSRGFLEVGYELTSQPATVNSNGITVDVI